MGFPIFVLSLEFLILAWREFQFLVWSAHVLSLI
jgi:hypothetical protein